MPPIHLAVEALEGVAKAGSVAKVGSLLTKGSGGLLTTLEEITGPAARVVQHTLEPAAMESLVTKMVGGVKVILEDPRILKSNIASLQQRLAGTIGTANRPFGYPAPEVVVDFDRAYGAMLENFSGGASNSYYVGRGLIAIDSGLVNAPLILANKAAQTGAKFIPGKAGAELVQAAAHENTHLLQDVLKIRRYLDHHPNATVDQWLRAQHPENLKHFDEAKRLFDDVVRMRQGKRLPQALSLRADALLKSDAEDVVIATRRADLVDSGVLHLEFHLPKAPMTAEAQFADFWTKFPKHNIPPSLQGNWNAIESQVNGSKISQAQAGRNFYDIAVQVRDKGVGEWKALYQQYRALTHEQEAHTVGDLAHRLFLALP